ncbi:hypothetical protein VTJ04DRAFT_5470 [Mycothermus thermophilus]|uniref:uncharacterized protein n=1 Tax=Humicola insolens TaxID=85995 RepID=UPI003742F857
MEGIVSKEFGYRKCQRRLKRESSPKKNLSTIFSSHTNAPISPCIPTLPETIHTQMLTFFNLPSSPFKRPDHIKYHYHTLPSSITDLNTTGVSS